MALGDERRALGRRNEAARRSIGQRNEASRQAAGDAMERARRAAGDRMESDRRGVDLVEDINRISKPPVQRRTLRPIAPVGGIPTQRGRADFKPRTDVGGGAAGLASPLTEGETGPGAVLAREYYATSTLTSSDGILTLDVQALKKLTMRDANGEPAVFDFAEPTP